MSEPAPEELLARARSLVPLIRQKAAESEAQRCVAPEVIEAIADAGLFRILQPKRWGGFEMDPRVLCDAQIAIAEGDMSTGWVYGILSVHNFQMGLFADQAARDVWGEDDSVRIASMFQAGGVTERVEGGYRFNGRWKFSSGCDHADWIFLGGIDDGEFLTCLVPKVDYSIVDTWNVSGLKATGSNDIEVVDAFVPDHRVHKSSDGFRCDSPGNKVNNGWLYRLPFHQVFIRVITNACIGGLQAMLDAYLEYAKTRVSVISGAPRGDPDAQWACANARATIDEAKMAIDRNFGALAAYAKKRDVPPFDERLLYKFQCSSVAERCLEAGRLLFECVGGTGIFAKHSFGRIYNDLIGARQHAASQFRFTGRSLGAHMLGSQIEEWYL